MIGISSTHLAVKTTNLTKIFGADGNQVHALRDVDLTVQRGRFTAVMGPSGSGKSTLMHCLAGLDGASSGEVEVAGQRLNGLSDNELTLFRRAHTGFIFQAFNLLPMLTAEQNIVLPLELAGRPIERDWFEQITGMLGLGDRLSHLPSQLSGGQQQRVAIARALVARPDIVFADEPTGNLDSVSSTEVLSYLRRSVRENGMTVVMVTHDLEAAAYADEVVIIRDGQVAAHLTQPSTDELVAALRGAPAGCS